MKKALWILLLLLLIGLLLWFLFCYEPTSPPTTKPCKDCPEVPLKFIVDYNDLHPDTIKAIDDLFFGLGGTPIDSCDCGHVVRWDFLTEEDDDFTIEERTATIMDTARLENTAYLSQDIYLLPRDLPKDPTCRDFTPKVSSITNPLFTAIIDSGLDLKHAALQNSIWQNPVDCEGTALGFNMIDRTQEPVDKHGHGTHIAGLASLQNPHNRMMAIKVVDNNGEGTLFNAICGIHFAVNNKARVINFSLGYKGKSNSTLELALKKAKKNNTIIVCSAGNEPPQAGEEPHWPGSFDLDNIINVAAVGQKEDDSWDLASFSYYDKETVDIAAPGVGIKSLALSTSSDPEDMVKSGTSMAAALVTQRIAEVLATFPPNVGNAEVLHKFNNNELTPVPALDGKTVTGKMLSVDYAAENEVCRNYCIPLPSIEVQDQHISGVTVNNFRNTNSGGCDIGGYSDFTRLSFELTPGTTSNSIIVQGAITCASTFTYTAVKAWIDYNQDFEFSADEEILSGDFTTYGDSEKNSFAVPTGLAAGSRRMRVRTWRGSPAGGPNNEPGMCSSTAYGEIEDYTVIIPTQTPTQIQ